MELKEALREVEICYSRMKQCGTTQGRKYNEKRICSIMEICPEVKRYWYYHPKRTYIIDRFGRHTIEVPQQIKESKITIINHIVCDVTYQARRAPIEEGVYFVGTTTFNPYTNEKQYWVKVGMTSDSIKKRLRVYDTHSPAIHHIDYFPCDNALQMESNYHRTLERISLGRSERSWEWWLVDEATYLKMSNMGFSYFEHL